MSGHKYPLTVAQTMGHSGRRCADIIDNPIRRYMPVMISTNNAGEYELIYRGEYDRLFTFPINEQAEDLRRKIFADIRLDLATPGTERTVFTLTNFGESDWTSTIFEEEAKKLIAKKFSIPLEYLFAKGDRVVYDKRKGKTLSAGVYDSAAWTGRHPKPRDESSSPESLKDAGERLERAWNELLESARFIRFMDRVSRWLATWTAKEAFLDEDKRVFYRPTYILALRRNHREEIKAGIERRNSFVHLRASLESFSIAIRNAAEGLRIALKPIHKNQ